MLKRDLIVLAEMMTVFLKNHINSRCSSPYAYQRVESKKLVWLQILSMKLCGLYLTTVLKSKQTSRLTASKFLHFFSLKKSSFSMTHPNIMNFCRESPDNVETSFPTWFDHKVNTIDKLPLSYCLSKSDCLYIFRWLVKKKWETNVVTSYSLWHVDLPVYVHTRLA